MRKSSFFFGYFLLNLLFLFLAVLHGGHEREQLAHSIQIKEELVRKLSLTDLCLFTEARYTRHPSQTDRYAPFQEHPLALEHFPSGSLLSPHVERRKE
jgi:hypothetical protein